MKLLLGVATFCREGFAPTHSEEGLAGTLPSSQEVDCIGCYGAIDQHFNPNEKKSLDSEGRCIMTQHDVIVDDVKLQILVIINVYCPRADPKKPERETFKLKFYKLLELRADALMKAGRHVVIVGDVNSSHRTIDHSDPWEVSPIVMVIMYF
jgi:AP endonuclease-2